MTIDELNAGLKEEWEKKSLFAKYILERESKNCIEDDKGFVTFSLVAPDTCYLEDMYVRPEYRKTGYSIELLKKVEAVAKEWGCSFVTTSVRPSGFGSTDSMKAILSAGFQLLRSQNDGIYFIKGVEDGCSN